MRWLTGKAARRGAYKILERGLRRGASQSNDTHARPALTLLSISVAWIKGAAGDGNTTNRLFQPTLEFTIVV